MPTVKANPFRCRMWDMHDRLEHHLSERTCSLEIRSIATHGQLIPALARPLKADPDHDFELIYGARRLFVARHLNIEVLLEVQDLSNQAAIVAMDVENRLRKDISAYERGLSYARWVRCGLFSSQEELARAVKMSPASISRVLKVASLPAVVVGAFNDATMIRENWGTSLAEALEDPAARPRIIAKARALKSLQASLAPEQIYRALMDAASGMRLTRGACRDEVVKDETGIPLFRVKYQRRSIAFVMPTKKVAPDTLELARRAMSEILRKGSRPAAGRVRAVAARPDAGSAALVTISASAAKD